MTALTWLVFSLYLNQMSHPTILLTSNLRTTRTRNQTKLRYIFGPYGHVLVPLLVPLRILKIVDLQEVVTPYSYKRPFQLVPFVLLLLFVIYEFVCLLSKLLLDIENLPLVPSFHHYNAIIVPILP